MDKIVYCFLKMLALLPLPILYYLSDILCLILMQVVRYRRRMVEDNLKRAFPEKDVKHIRKITRGFYYHLSDCIVETIKLLHMSDDELDLRINVIGGDLVEETAKDGKPIILFLGHYGNWEWVQAISRHYKSPRISAEIYRPLKNRSMDKVMKHIRSRFSTVAIPQKQAVRQLLKMNREGQQFMVGFIADQRPNSKNLYHWTTFLHQDTAYATGGEEIGHRIQANYFFLDVKKPRRGHYLMTFRKMTLEDSNLEEYPYTKKFLRLMEESILQEPAFWLWSHNRWEFDRKGNKIH